MNAKTSVPGVVAAAALLLLASVAFGQDYPGAVWNPANAGNYGVASRTAPDIRWVIIHTTEDAPGSDCSVSQNWFKNPASGVSAHYVICRDGTVVQMVRDKDIAYHAGNLAYNNQSIGIEHERHGTSNWTEPQFQASGELVRWLVSRYNVQGVFPNGIAPANPTTGCGIIGHNQVPDPTNPALGGGMNQRTDPVNLDWPRYQALFTSSNFLITAEPAIRVTVPTRESYQYQIFSSTDFANCTNWQAASDKITACSSKETFSFPATNSNAFYRAQEFPPDLSKRIVGLTNVFLDTASVSSLSNKMTISGMRVQSRDYNFNDYVIATYELDLCKQLFSVQRLEVLTNVGLTCGTSPLFFLKDATDSIFMTNGATTYSADTPFTLTSSGQDLFVGLHAAQTLSFQFSASTEFQFFAYDPSGIQISSLILPAQCNGCVIRGINAFRTGRYSVRFVPRNAASFSITLRFINRNRRSTRALTNGQTVSLRNYAYDYDRYKVALNAGQTLTVSGAQSGTCLSICNSLGIENYSACGNLPFIFQASVSDTYYLIFYTNDWLAHMFQIGMSIAP